MDVAFFVYEYICGESISPCASAGPQDAIAAAAATGPTQARAKYTSKLN